MKFGIKQLHRRGDSLKSSLLNQNIKTPYSNYEIDCIADKLNGSCKIINFYFCSMFKNEIAPFIFQKVDVDPYLFH